MTKTNVPAGRSRRCATRWCRLRVERVGRRLERPLEIGVPEQVLAPWRVPERLALALVEVAEQAAGGDRAVGDEPHRAADRLRLLQPRPAFGEDRHRRPAVDERDDARRLLGEVLADDELVRAARERQPRRRVPVDAVDVVARLVRAGAGDVRAEPAAGAVQGAERQAEHPPPRDQWEGRRRQKRFRWQRGLATKMPPSPPLSTDAKAIGVLSFVAMASEPLEIRPVAIRR